jgi:hypothetical protein
MPIPLGRLLAPPSQFASKILPPLSRPERQAVTPLGVQFGHMNRRTFSIITPLSLFKMQRRTRTPKYQLTSQTEILRPSFSEFHGDGASEGKGWPVASARSAGWRRVDGGRGLDSLTRRSAAAANRRSQCALRRGSCSCSLKGEPGALRARAGPAQQAESRCAGALVPGTGRSRRDLGLAPRLVAVEELESE